MKAIILAAGKGTRLYPITLNKPKGLLEIGNETILGRLIRQFNELGIADILLVVGYQKEKLIDHFVHLRHKGTELLMTMIFGINLMIVK